MTGKLSNTVDPARQSSPSILRSAAALGIASVASQATNFVFMVLIGRIYGPVEVGLFGIFNVVFTFAAFTASWRYELAIVTLEDDQQADDLVLFVMAAGCASGLIATLVVVLIAVWPWGLPVSADLAKTLVLLPVTLVLASAILAGTNLCTRQGHFGRVALQQVVLALLAGAMPIVVHRLEMPTNRLVAGFALGQAGALLVLLAPLSAALKRSLIRSERMMRLRRVAAQNRAHFYYTVPYSLATQIYYQGPLIFLGLCFGAREVGLFSLAYRTTSTPFNLIPASLAQVFFPEMARDRSRLARWEPKLLSLMVALGLLLAPITAILLIWGPAIYAFVLGQEWRDAGVYVQVLALASLMTGLASGYDRLYFVQHKQAMALVLTLAALISSALLMVTMYYAHATAEWMVAGWSIVQFGLSVGWTMTIYRITGFSISPLVLRLVLIFVSVGILAAVLAIVPTLWGTVWLVAALAIVCLCYGLVTAIAWFKFAHAVRSNA
jgi:O-antigen/teichoic acid export membrane protein